MNKSARIVINQTPAKWFTASYGDDGLIVDFFTDPLAYGRAINDLQRRHAAGGWDIDSYTYGDATITSFVEEIA